MLPEHHVSKWGLEDLKNAITYANYDLNVVAKRLNRSRSQIDRIVRMRGLKSWLKQHRPVPIWEQPDALFVNALRKNAGNVVQAAKYLGCAPSFLYSQIKKRGLRGYDTPQKTININWSQKPGDPAYNVNV